MKSIAEIKHDNDEAARLAGPNRIAELEAKLAERERDELELHAILDRRGAPVGSEFELVDRVLWIADRFEDQARMIVQAKVAQREAEAGAGALRAMLERAIDELDEAGSTAAHSHECQLHKGWPDTSKPSPVCTCGYWERVNALRQPLATDAGARVLDAMRKAVEALDSMEWAVSPAGLLYCPWCNGGEARPSGHAPDCKRQAALAALQELVLPEDARRSR